MREEETKETSKRDGERIGGEKDEGGRGSEGEVVSEEVRERRYRMNITEGE